MLRIRRWALQAAARVALWYILREDKMGRKQQKFRVTRCCRVRRRDERPKIKKAKSGLHHYSGLQMCGSVWTCPVCGTKISERRRLELKAGIEEWERQGGTVVMLTQTVPHYLGDSLVSVLEPFKQARRLQRKRKPWQRWATQYLEGTVTAQEVTYGDNGWHVHTHELLFLNASWKADMAAYRANNPLLYVKNDKQTSSTSKRKQTKDPFLVMQAEILYPTWADAVESAGLSRPSQEHGLDLSDSDEVAGYVGKWGVDYELTKAHLKEGRKGGRTPWAILTDWLEHGDEEDQRLFQEFALGFHGRSQLTWSRGLKALVLVEEKTDEEILLESEKGEEVIRLTLDQWRAIIKHDQRGRVLEVANLYGRAAVIDYIGDLLNGTVRDYNADYATEKRRMSNRNRSEQSPPTLH